MNPDLITGLILTFNEQDNLERTLAALDWLPRVLVLDSGSSDDTLAIAGRHANVTVIERPFDDFASQRNFGLDQVPTPWVLSLDADHVVSPELSAEMTGLEPADAAAFNARFRYLVWGKPLRSSILPPRPVLFRPDRCRYEPDGHSERLLVDGQTLSLEHGIDHDDRKPFSRWLAAQDRYACQEAAKLREEGRALGLADRIRRLNWLAPLAVLFYVLVVRGGLLDGRRGLFYAYQRMLAELLLALRRLDNEANR